MKAQALIFLFFLIYSSCTRYLVPSWYDPEVHEKKYSRITDDRITVVVDNLEVNDQHLVFDVEIRNESTHPVHIDPEKMYYLASTVPFPPETLTKSGSSFESNLKKNQAISEKGVAEQLEQKIIEQRRAGILVGILSAGLMIYDAAMDAKDFSSSEWTPKKANNALVRDVVTMAGLTAMDVVQQQSTITTHVKGSDLFFLPDEILKSEVLAPGESCRGKVFFATTRDKYIKLIIPVENTEYAFDFRWADVDDLRKLQKIH